MKNPLTPARIEPAWQRL